MRLVLIGVVVVVVAVAAVMLAPRSTQHATAPQPVLPESTGTPAPPLASVEPSWITHPEIGFKTRAKLEEHFQKHGRDFNARDADAYLELAQTLRDRPAGGMVLEAVRRDHVVTRFDRASGAFIAFDRDLTIRTFFRPNDGEEYFRRQLEREP